MSRPRQDGPDRRGSRGEGDPHPEGSRSGGGADGTGSSEGDAPLWLRLTSRLVPENRREAWLREWRAELAHRGETGRIRLLDHLAPLEDALGFRRTVGGGAGPVAGILRDLRLALRTLRSSPGFTATVVLTLGVAIGANTAVFSLVEDVLLRPLPYERPDEVARVEIGFGRAGEFTPLAASGPEYLELEEAHVFEEIAGYWTSSVNLGGIEEPLRIPAAAVSPEFLPLLGIDAALGRGFTEEDGRPGAAEVALLGHGLWERAFGGDPGVLGRDVIVNGRPATVVGVLPPDFEFPGAEVELLRPLTLDRADPGRRSSHWLSVLARLRSGLGLEAAQSELDALFARWQEERPELHQLGGSHPAFLVSVREAVAGDSRRSLLILMGAVGVVLLVACVNLANLLLVRGESRAREMGVRTALGAGRGALARQLLVESLVAAVLGGMLGVGMAAWAVRFIPELAAGSLPPGTSPELDLRVLAFSVVVTAGAGVLFGLLPAWRASRADVAGLIREGGGARSRSAGRASVLLQRLLVAGEVAAAVALVAAAAVLGRSLAQLAGVETGFETEGVVVMDFALSSGSYPETADLVAFHRELDRRLAESPGVEAAGAIRTLPLRGPGGWESLELLDQQFQDPDADATVAYQVASPGYFEAMSIPVIEGRGFRAGDHTEAPPVALLNETGAREFFPEGGAVGRRIRLGAFPGNTNPAITVVGVVGDVRQVSLDNEIPPQLYVPRAQAGLHYGGLGTRFATLAVKGAGGPSATLQATRAVLRQMDPNLPVTGMRTLDEHVTRSLGDRRFMALLMGGFSAVVLLLGALGLYGLLGYVVSRRTREIGIRLALGARSREVLGRVVAEATALVVLGSIVGVGAALLGADLLEGLVYGVDPRDPVLLAVAPGVLLLVGVAAALAPARRAASVDPTEALRAEG